jgi:hypothetical protein
MLANPAPEAAAAGAEKTRLVPTLARHGFEIVDKRANKEVYLDGSWAELFQEKLVGWQRKPPTLDEIEQTLEGYAGLAAIPIMVH